MNYTEDSNNCQILRSRVTGFAFLETTLRFARSSIFSAKYTSVFQYKKPVASHGHF